MLHKAMSIILAAVGSIQNLLTVVKGKLHSQKSFMFVLNLFVSNLLMSSVGIRLYVVPAFLTYPGNDVICPFSGFVWNLFAEQYAYYFRSLHLNRAFYEVWMAQFSQLETRALSFPFLD